QQELRQLQIQLELLRKQLSVQSIELYNAQIRLWALSIEVLNLQRGIEEIMRQQAEENTMWAYLASFFSRNSQEAEVKKTQRDRDRLQKIATRSIKENIVKQQNSIIQTYKRAIDTINENIHSTETKIRVREDQERRKIEKEILRQKRNKMKEQEEKKAREATKKRERKAKESHEADQAKNKQNSHSKQTCLHRCWWN
ncbi:hypothetical protein BGW36DRAFT_452023, partial [Talaromyces proteolyticus]